MQTADHEKENKWQTKKTNYQCQTRDCVEIATLVNQTFSDNQKNVTDRKGT